MGNGDYWCDAVKINDAQWSFDLLQDNDPACERHNW
jgi:hypothetical protein